MIGTAVIWGILHVFVLASAVQVRQSADLLSFSVPRSYAKYEGWKNAVKAINFWFRLDRLPENKESDRMLLLYSDIGADGYLCVFVSKEGFELLMPSVSRKSKLPGMFFDGKWHFMRVLFESRNVTLSVDGEKKTPQHDLEQDVPLNIADSMFIGGIPEKVNPSYGTLRFLIEPDCSEHDCVRFYKGCIANFNYSLANGIVKKPKLLSSKTEDYKKCSACAKKGGHSCKHGGRCVDQLPKTECDCAGTGYEGRECETEKSFALRFRGHTSRVVYPLGGTKDKEYAKIAFRFISAKEDGVLFRMGIVTAKSDWLLIELTGGRIKVRFNFGDGEKSITFPDKTFGACWHWVQLKYEGPVVEMSVDRGEVRTEHTTADGRHLNVKQNDAIFGGGLNTSKGNVSFEGFMQDLYFNDSRIPEERYTSFKVGKTTLALKNLINSCSLGTPSPSRGTTTYWTTTKRLTKVVLSTTPREPGTPGSMPVPEAVKSRNVSVWTIVVVVFAAILAVGATVYIIYRWNNRYSGSFNPSTNNPEEEEGVVSGKNGYQFFFVVKNPTRGQQDTKAL